MECTECGEPVGDEVKFCGECGTKVDRCKPLLKQMKNTHDLRILLVGHTGHGKSATGNSLLGITYKEGGFIDQMSPGSVTKNYSRKVQTRFGRQLEVVDTPGFFDTSFKHKFVYEQIYHCNSLTLPGFNAICLVLRPERFTPQLVKTVDIFLKLFGKGIEDYAFVILTHIQNEEQMNEFTKEAKTTVDEGYNAFQMLKQRCKEKLLFINNKAPEKVKEQMVWNILTAVDEANARASRPYFQNKQTRRIEQKAKEFYQIHVLGLGYKRPKEDLRILLIGLPGHGKSATRNSLLGLKSMFPEKRQAYQPTLSGRMIMIEEFTVKDPLSNIDQPLNEQLLQTETKLHPGFHAVFFLINPNRLEELKNKFQPIMKYFGDEANDFAFVLMTFTNNEDELETKISKYNKEIEDKKEFNEVTSVYEFCKDKELYIDNMGSPHEKEEIIKDMFLFIDSENANKITPFFSSRFKLKVDTVIATRQTEAEEARVAEVARAKEVEIALRSLKVAEDARAAESARAAYAEAARVAETAKAFEALNAFAKAAEAARASEAERVAQFLKRLEEKEEAFEAYKKQHESSCTII